MVWEWESRFFRNQFGGSVWSLSRSLSMMLWRDLDIIDLSTLQGTNITPKNCILKMIFLFPRWDMLVPWRVTTCLFVCLFVLELLEMGWRFNTSYCHCKSPTDDKISVEFPGVYSESSKTNGIPRRKNKKTIYRINIWWDAHHQSFWKDWVVSKLPTGRCRKHFKNYGVYVVHESQLLANHLGSNAQVWRSSLPLGLTKQRCRDHWLQPSWSSRWKSSQKKLPTECWNGWSNW